MLISTLALSQPNKKSEPNEANGPCVVLKLDGRFAFSATFPPLRRESLKQRLGYCRGEARVRDPWLHINKSSMGLRLDPKFQR